MFTPTHSSFLNPIEYMFGKMKQKMMDVVYKQWRDFAEVIKEKMMEL